MTIPLIRIISINVNGIRSAEKKGLFGWLKYQRANIICLQEVRASSTQIKSESFHLKGFQRFLVEAEKPGYSGVSVYTKDEPIRTINKIGDKEFDAEGRYIEVEFQKFSVASVYFPSGSSGEARQEAKYRFLDIFDKKLIAKRKKPVIFCGDFNIAHTKQDIKNWRGNQKNSGFLPEERLWFDRLLQKGYIDSFRHINKNDDEYTWWSNRGRARENNVGWRIDYQVASNFFNHKVKKVKIYREEFFSDHAPLIIDYELDE